MGSMSIMHWMIVIAVVVLLFGRGKISGLIGDVADGIKSFRKGMREEEPASGGLQSGQIQETTDGQTAQQREKLPAL